MRSILALALFAATLSAAAAEGPKPCEELKAEIAAKIDARGVPHYTLEIVDPDATGERKVVGSCAGGSKRIVYQRLPADGAAEAPAVASRGG
jgi:hypothetical protein